MHTLEGTLTQILFVIREIWWETFERKLKYSSALVLPKFRMDWYHNFSAMELNEVLLRKENQCLASVSVYHTKTSCLPLVVQMPD